MNPGDSGSGWYLLKQHLKAGRHYAVSILGPDVGPVKQIDLHNPTDDDWWVRRASSGGTLYKQCWRDICSLFSAEFRSFHKLILETYIGFRVEIFFHDRFWASSFQVRRDSPHQKIHSRGEQWEKRDAQRRLGGVQSELYSIPHLDHIV